jgi:hypothetical protein
LIVVKDGRGPIEVRDQEPLLPDLALFTTTSWRLGLDVDPSEDDLRLCIVDMYCSTLDCKASEQEDSRFTLPALMPSMH